MNFSNSNNNPIFDESEQAAMADAKEMLNSIEGNLS